jgi:hypothetical protein
MGPLLLCVNLFRRDELSLSDFHLAVTLMGRTEKAGFVTFVAGSTNLFDLNEDRVSIAIKCDVFDGLRVTAGFPFHPEFLARTAPKMGFSGGDRFLQGHSVHPGHHENAASRLFLNNGGDQSGGLIEFQLVVKAHV